MNNYANKEYDAIVVGSGPGGATVARELTRNSQKVLLLEWGDYNPVTGSKTQAIKNMGMPMQSMLFTYNMVGLVRGLT
ncbi:MAG: NAD(P)-binding protein, partial [Thermodesulfobacteriota bacterium]